MMMKALLFVSAIALDLRSALDTFGIRVESVTSHYSSSCPKVPHAIIDSRQEKARKMVVTEASIKKNILTMKGHCTKPGKSQKKIEVKVKIDRKKYENKYSKKKHPEAYHSTVTSTDVTLSDKNGSWLVYPGVPTLRKN